MENATERCQPTMTPKRSRKKITVLLILTIIVIVCVAGTIYYFNQKSNGSYSSKETPTSSNRQPEPENDANDTKATINEQAKVAQTPKIYYTKDGNLYSIDTQSKQVTEIDTAINYGSSASGLGSSEPLNSFDLLKVIYSKDNDIWLKENGHDPRKIDRVIPDQTKCPFRIYFTAWSSNSKNLVYKVSFDEGMGGLGCEPTDEDNNTVGFYWYSLDSAKSTKLPISQAEMWVPQSNKIAFFERTGDENQLKTYDVVTKTTETLSKSGWIGYTPQLAFSDDGTKIIYSHGHTAAISSSKIIIANRDNTAQEIKYEGSWADYQFPKFINKSNNNFFYTYNTKQECPSGGLCPAQILHSNIDNIDKEIVGIVDRYYTLVDNGKILFQRGYFYDKNGDKTLAIFDPTDSTTIDILKTNEVLDFSIGW